MKPILRGAIWGIVAWILTTILMMIAFACYQIIGDVVSRSVYWLANWPLIIWSQFAPINSIENAYVIGIIRNLIGWLGLMIPAALVYDLLNKRKKNKNGA